MTMPSLSAMQGADRSRRSFTWPPSSSLHARPSFSRGMLPAHISSSPDLLSGLAPPSPPSTLPTPTTSPPTSKPVSDPFEDELQEHPDAHFLSPLQMYEYEDWASDSDDDGAEEQLAWDAGITDFALFDSDRRRAQERHEGMPDHWENLMASQARALQRAVERNRADTDPHTGKPWTPLLEDLPQLTPDHSPNLRDQLDVDSHYARPAAHVPEYLSSRIASSDEELDDSASDMDYDDDDGMDDDDDDEDYDTPISVLLARSRERQRQSRRLDRPGLRHSRTMSGKVHVWRRPSLHIYPVGEDVEAERKAEMLAIAEETGRQSS